jgi:hypothetical protein
MKKTLAVVLMGALLLIPMSAAVARTNPAKRHMQCRYESWNGKRGFTDEEVRKTIACAVDHFPTSLSTAFYVANRESGYECKAQNPYSSAGGVFQVVDGTWASWWDAHDHRFRGWGLHNNKKLCRSNVMLSIRSAHMWGWGPWGM